MKKWFYLMAMFAVSPVVLADSTVKEGVKEAVTGMVSSGKNVLTGIKEGIDGGRKSGESVDGSIVIVDKEELQKYVAASVQSVEKIGDTDYKITLVLRNNSDQSVRLTNLLEPKSLQLLDNDGFVSYIVVKNRVSASEADITIPEKSATRVRYEFSEVEGVPATLRLYGLDIAVPAAK